MTKICKKCELPLELSFFAVSKNYKDGLCAHCKKCEAERQHEKYLRKTGQTQTTVHKHTIEKCHEHAAKHGGVCLSTEYVNADTRYLWRCSCGNEWMASLPTSSNRWCSKCGKEKARQTWLKNYGVDNPNKDPAVRLRGVRKMTNAYVLQHWKTGAEVVCKGMYERNIVIYLNNLKIDYDWQVPFKLPNGKTYFIDLLDKSRNVYVEIKGYWRDDAKEKFELFKLSNPHLLVEVWDKAWLKARKIPTRGKRL